MKQYIDFEIAREYLHKACESLGGNGGMMLKIKFDEEPKADVVKVVRCKDCAYHYNPLADCCGVPFVTTDDDFCSWGERREDAEIH